MNNNNNFLLLSIDGGGVRGKIATTFLALLEQDLGKSIFNTFDFFAGTSTGALIVLGITANQYDSEKISGLYNEVNLNRIFKKTFWDHLPIQLGAKYSGDGKRQFLDEIFAGKQFLSVTKPTLINAYDFIDNKAVIFKSSGGSDSAYNPTVAEVADASSAAPTYFPSVLTSEKTPRNLIDGGIAANNPSMCLISQALNQGYSLQSIRLLSLGTGYAPIRKNISLSPKNWGPIDWFKNGIIDDFMLGDSSMIEYQCKTILGNNYLRINGSLGAVSSALDDISKDNLKQLEALGQQWYHSYKDIVLQFLLE